MKAAVAILVNKTITIWGFLVLPILTVEFMAVVAVVAIP